MELAAVTADGKRSITDRFEVREWVAFDIERIGPTRIYPPETYPMKFNIKANQDFRGQVVEKLPESFEVIEDSGFRIQDSGIIWQVDWKAGETYELSYIFDAPNTSPEFYLIGPLKLGVGVQGIGFREVFVEKRQWQIAVDVVDVTQIHYRWRNDDGDEVDTGDGADGALAPTGTFNINTGTTEGRTYADGVAYRVDASTATGTTIDRFSASDVLNNGIASGDEVLLISLQGASGDVADVGNYEFLEVSSVSATQLTFTTSIVNSYDGTTAADQRVVVQRIPNYTSVTLNSTDSLTASAWEALATAPSGSAGRLTGIVVLRATGTVDVQTGTSITVDGLGYIGGTGGTSDGGLNGESYDGVGSAGTSSGGDDVTEGSGGGNPGTRGGGGSSNSGLTTSGNTAGTRGGGGGGGNVDGNIADDGAGGGGGGGYGFGGGGGGGGGDSTSGGAGGSAASTSVNGGGGGAGSDGPAVGGVGGNAGSAAADDGSGGGDGGAVGSGDVTGLGGSGGTTTFTGVGSAGGGGGGNYSTAALTTIFLGSGGGGGGGADSGVGRSQTTGATGGDGGGIIFIAANTITITSTGTVTSDGAAGAQGGTDAGGSGGGSGGSVMLQANNVTLGTNLVTGTGASGGALNDNAGAGGDGGDGRIRVETGSVTSVTTDPAASLSPDAPAGATFAFAQDTVYTSLLKNTIVRVRFELSNEGDTSSGAVTYQLEFAETATCSSGTYVAVPTDTSQDFQIVASTFINDADPTANVHVGGTQALTDESATFIVGELKDTGNTTGSITLASNEFTEIEFSIQALNSATENGNYCFRLTNVDTYTTGKIAEAVIVPERLWLLFGLGPLLPLIGRIRRRK